MRKPKDPVVIAKSIYDQILSIHDPGAPDIKEPLPTGPDPKAQMAGRLGGQAGGLARAANLTPKRRKTIARKAAQARWGK